MAPKSDARLIQIVDAAAAEAAQRAGAWVKCRPGCTQCCVGVFPISQLDAARLRGGLDELRDRNPARANMVRGRAQQAVARLATEFPGNARTGILDPQRNEDFEEFGNEEPCPALDPETGLCDLYAARPITCRVFGLPLRTQEGIGVCELCFQGASADEIGASVVHPDYEGVEAVNNAELERVSGLKGNTIIAWALAAERR